MTGGAIKDPAHTGTSKGLSQAINSGPIRKFLPNYANVYVTIQSHGFSAGAQSHYVTANGVRDGLRSGGEGYRWNVEVTWGPDLSHVTAAKTTPGGTFTHLGGVFFFFFFFF